MPVHDLGYRGWQGARMERLLRPLVVAISGISLVWRRRFLRLMITMAWLPVLIPAGVIFMFESSNEDPEYRTGVAWFLQGNLVNNPELARDMITGDPADARHEVWSTVILFFFQQPQLITMTLLVGIISPMLICYDLRSKAYLMYFSRPLTPLEYILGKSAVLWFFLGMITTVPALLLYFVGVLLSPDLSVIGDTWDIPIRTLFASVVFIVPTTMIAICYSSFTSESRYASFAWFATWIMGLVAYYVLTQSSTRWVQDNYGRWHVEGYDPNRWLLVSPYNTIKAVEQWIFLGGGEHGGQSTALILLGIFTVLGVWIVRKRLLGRLSV